MKTKIAKFSQCKALVVGDLMADEYVWGEVCRISPEAPVPIVSVTKEEFTLGGSGNVVNNLASLGAEVFPAGVVGSGRNGKKLVKRLTSSGISAEGIIISQKRSTTRKTRIIAGNQHVLRIDRETTKEISEQLFAKLIKFIKSKITQTDVIIISDYAKGVVTKSLIEEITAYADKHKKIVIADPKGLDFTKYQNVDFLTPNKKEAGIAAGMDVSSKTLLYQAAEKIIKTSGIKNLLITCGKQGMVLFQPNKKPYQIKSKARQVFDVSGAGDTVIAVFGLALAAGEAPGKAAALANTAAGIVVGKLGTAAVTIQELTQALKEDSNDSNRNPG